MPDQAPATDNQLKLVGWAWLSHGALLLIGAGGLVLMQGMMNYLVRELGYDLPRQARAGLQHMQAVMADLAAFAPYSAALGAVVIPVSMAFLKRRAWARTAVIVLSWLHLALIPLAAWHAFTMPPVLMQFDQAGQPIPGFGLASHVMHGVSLAMMAALLLVMTWMVHRPSMRAQFTSD
ncbi:MAG: hypothetical protein PF961_00635 [Planctomycetota bacterium]|jgi:hypothetical protein|nr:hypothetical protein [Planctomycetota bacterium]